MFGVHLHYSRVLHIAPFDFLCGFLHHPLRQVDAGHASARAGLFSRRKEIRTSPCCHIEDLRSLADAQPFDQPAPDVGVLARPNLAKARGRAAVERRDVGFQGSVSIHFFFL